MAYAGGKAKIAGKIAACIRHYAQGRRIVEPFCGSLAVTAKLGNVAIASDICEPLINMYKAVRAGWVPPDYVSREDHRRIKATRDPDDPMTAFVGFWHCFGGDYFAGYKPYRKGSHMPGGAARVVQRDVARCANTTLICQPYGTIDLRRTDCAYLDPPYAGTMRVGDGRAFDHDEFWQWCRRHAERGTELLISEMAAPEDFDSVLTLTPNTRCAAAHKRGYRTEYVFRWKGAKSIAPLR